MPGPELAFHRSFFGFLVHLYRPGFRSGAICADGLNVQWKVESRPLLYLPDLELQAPSAGLFPFYLELRLAGVENPLPEELRKVLFTYRFHCPLEIFGQGIASAEQGIVLPQAVPEGLFAYLPPEQTRAHAVKIFIPGLVRTDVAFIDRCVATVRGWRDYVRSIRRVEAMDFDILAPGHGPVGRKADAAAFREYLTTLYNAVLAGARQGMSLDQMKATITLEKYKDWGQYKEFRALNIEGMYRLVQANRRGN